MKCMDGKSVLPKKGDRFGDYVVERKLGEGGMGIVYLALGSDGRQYAVKIMPPTKMTHDLRRRFTREAEFAMKVRHPNLISVYDVGEDPENGWCYLVMDYVSGGSLADRLKTRGRFPIEEAVAVVAQIAAGLDAAHRHGLVHRDIKPDNILFDADGTPKLADLGVAKFEEYQQSVVTATGVIIGTPAYMAPEQMVNSHEVDLRADIYSLGVVLYEMLTGKRPNDGSTAIELMAKAVKGEPLPDVRTMCPELSASIAYVLSLMCAPRPEGRPQTVSEAADLLDKAVRGTLTLPKKILRGMAEEKVAQRRKRRMRLLRVFIGVGLVALVTVGIFGWIKALEKNVARTIAMARVDSANTRTNILMTTKANVSSNVVKQADFRQPKKKRGITDRRVRYAKVGTIKWYYTLEDGAAVIWRGIEGWYKGTLPAMEPSTGKHFVVPQKLDGYKVAKIGHLAFINCTNMVSIVIPDGVKELQSECFFKCDRLEKVKLPSALEFIEGYAFSDCKSLETLDVGVCTNFSGAAFGKCPRLSNVSVSRTNAAYFGMGGALYTRDKETLVFYPHTAQTVLLPRSVKKIGTAAFQFLSELERVSIPVNITELSERAFYGCGKLVDVHIESGLQNVGDLAFSKCNALRRISFPGSLRNIGGYVFHHCKNLEEIVFDGDAPKINYTGSQRHRHMFRFTPKDLVITVNRGSKGWKEAGSAELPKMWPVDDAEDSRTIRFKDLSGNVTNWQP